MTSAAVVICTWTDDDDDEEALLCEYVHYIKTMRVVVVFILLPVSFTS